MLINCVAYQNGEKLADIPIEDISEYVHRPDCFVWVALFEPTPEELDQMAEEFELHPLAVEDAQKRPPATEDRGIRGLAVRGAADGRTTERGADVGPAHRRSRDLRRHATTSCRCAFAPRRVSPTCAHAPSASRSCCESAPAYVLYALMDTVVDRYFPVLDALECELEKIEEQIFVRNSARSNIESLYALKQKLMMLKHAVDPMMEATGKLYGGRVPQICAGMQEYFRDVYDHLHRIHESIEGIREMLTHGDPGQPRHDQPQRDRGDEEARRRGPPSSRFRR